MERRAGRAVQPDRMTEGPAPTQVPSPSAAPEATRASVICYNMYISQEQIVNHIVTISVITQTVITLLVDLSMNTRPLLHRLRPRQIMLLLSTEPRAQEGSTTGNFSSYPGVPAPRSARQPVHELQQLAESKDIGTQTIQCTHNMNTLIQCTHNMNTCCVVVTILYITEMLQLGQLF